MRALCRTRTNDTDKRQHGQEGPDCARAVWVQILVLAGSYLFGALASFVYKNRFRNTQLFGQS